MPSVTTVLIKYQLHWPAFGHKYVIYSENYHEIKAHFGKKTHIMTSSNGNSFRVIGPMYGEFIGHRWITLTKASDAELCCFLWSAYENRLSKQSRRRRFETPSHSLDITVMIYLTWCHMTLKASHVTWQLDYFTLAWSASIQQWPMDSRHKWPVYIQWRHHIAYRYWM